MAKVLSSMLAVTILAPMIAPIIGSYLLVHLGWRSNFYFLASYGSLLLLSACFVKESYPKAVRKSLPVSKLLRAYLQQTKFTPFLLAMLAVSANFAVLFAFISSSSFIYIKIYHLAAHLFGYFFAFNAAGLILGNLSLNYLKSRLSDKKIIIGAILLSFFGILVMLIAILVDPKSIWSVACPLFVVTYGVGILYPELTAQALHHVIDYNGLASSLIGTCRFFLAAVLGVIMGLLIHRSALPLAIVMLILNGCLALFMLFYFQRTPSAQ